MGKDHPTVLIAAAQGGDQQAKDQLVSAYLPLLYNVVGRALDGHADVDDVVQETVLRMLRSLPELRDPERFRSWLVAIAMNEIRTHWRERQSGALPADRLEAAYDLPDPRADFVEVTILELGLTGQRRQSRKRRAGWTKTIAPCCRCGGWRPPGICPGPRSPPLSNSPRSTPPYGCSG